jgi:hypothetical protein
MILIIVLSLELDPGTDQDLETCSVIFLNSNPTHVK